MGLFSLQGVACAGDRSGAPEDFRRAALDDDSRVRRTAIRLLGDSGDPGLVSFLQDRFREDDSYLVQAEALRSIGRMGDHGHLAFLQQAREMPSHQDLIREAAEWAIQAITTRT